MAKDQIQNDEPELTKVDYEKYFKEQEDYGNVQDALPEFYEFKEKDDVLTGIYLGNREVKSADTKGEFLIHAMDTNMGSVEFIGGKQIDRILNDPGIVNKLVRITFKGVENLSGGRKLKKFSVFYTEAPKGN